ncbi:SDR family NAD(P)-dependent oxidoreductase, partial [Chloroflexota bacterium]
EDGELTAVVDEIRKLGRRSLAMQVDITRKADVEHFVQEVVDQFGVIDILVNNAAVKRGGLLVELPEEDWDIVIDTDLKGTWLCSQAVAKRMIEQKNGTIINMSSIAGLWSLPSRNGAYNMAKAGVILLTKVLARNFGRYNIRVNAIAPGMVEEPLSESLWSDAHYRQMTERMIPLGNRLGQMSDIIGPALFLASEASVWVSGHTLIVDGGMVC